MDKPKPMQMIADPPGVWASTIDVLIEQLQKKLGENTCPPWLGACPLRTDGSETCWGEKACWLYYAYTMGVVRMVTEGFRRARVDIVADRSQEE